MPTIRMYSTAVCPFCQRAEMLLKSKGVAEIEKIRVDLDSARRDEMIQKTGRRTVPQIYIGEVHVGGFDDLAALDRAGKLDALCSAKPDAAFYFQSLEHRMNEPQQPTFGIEKIYVKDLSLEIPHAPEVFLGQAAASGCAAA